MDMNQPFHFAFRSAAALQALSTANVLPGMGCIGLVDGALTVVEAQCGSMSGAGYYLPNDNAIYGLTWKVVG